VDADPWQRVGNGRTTAPIVAGAVTVTASLVTGANTAVRSCRTSRIGSGGPEFAAPSWSGSTGTPERVSVVPPAPGSCTTRARTECPRNVGLSNTIRFHLWQKSAGCRYRVLPAAFSRRRGFGGSTIGRKQGDPLDTVFIRGLQVPTIVGVHDWERQVKQVLVFDVEMAADVPRAAREDNVDDALDYSAVCQMITRVVAEGRFKLVETVADRLADLLMSEYQPSWLRLEVQKPLPLSGGHVAGVAVERGIRDSGH
jgi:dihydroneopterin aldolase